MKDQMRRLLFIVLIIVALIATGVIRVTLICDGQRLFDTQSIVF